jgi:hypothetical protein
VKKEEGVTNLRIASHVRSMADETGAVLLDLKAGVYYSLNGTAARIWDKVEEGLTLPEIREHLLTCHPAAAVQIDRDLETFVGTLQRKGLLHGE